MESRPTSKSLTPDIPQLGKIGLVKSPDRADLKFLNFTSYNQTIDPETKRRVRSHVMHRVQQDLRRHNGRQKKSQVVLDISSLFQRSQDVLQVTPEPTLGQLLVPSPLGLGAGRSDPFALYPIDMDIRTHELFDHLHGRACPMFKTLEKIGFFKVATDDAAFRQILCTSSTHMARLREGAVTPESALLSMRAIRSLTRKIADPILSTSDGVIITVLAFACHTIMFNDLPGSLVHLNGLEEIIRRRGGLQSLNSNPIVRTVMFWMDTNTAFLHDHVPRFPVPYDILPPMSIQPYISASYPLILDVCLKQEMVSAVCGILILNQVIKTELLTKFLWDDGIFAGLRVVPLLNKLLSIRFAPDEDPFAVQECYRIGAILYLAGIRSRFGVDLPTRVYITKLKMIMTAQNFISKMNYSILLWVVLIGGVQSYNMPAHNWFVSATVDLVIKREGLTWDELMVIVREVLWIEGLFEAECCEFRKEFSAELWRLHHSMPSR